MTGRIHSFESFGAVDGPGIRYVLFLQGCPMRCKFCHNPDTWDQSAGSEYTADEIVRKIEPFRNFYRGGGGVTLSGGEPLMQTEFCRELIEKLHEKNFEVAIDTSGAIPLEKCRETIEAADMLLLDIKTANPEKCQTVTGNPNSLRNELDYLDLCQSMGKRVWIRHVLVPGLTDDEGDLQLLRQIIGRYSCIEKVEVLPFHKMGEHKWIPELYTLSETEAPSAEAVARAKEILTK